MADGTIPFVRIEALAALGAERLAETLRESARDDPRLRERLVVVLAGSPPVRIKPPGGIVSSIKRRIVALPNGSCLVMRGKAQQYWLHQPPEIRAPVGPRINLTFRRMVGEPSTVSLAD
jgi:hypothetical protein